jgi:hypothetical protein
VHFQAVHFADKQSFPGKAHEEQGSCLVLESLWKALQKIPVRTQEAA